VDFETFDARLLELADALQGADEATVAAEIDRLTVLAQQVEDERSRRLALIRVQKLPELINGPRPGSSPQFRRASTLVAQVISGTGTPAERIAHAERAKAEIAELSAQAPPRESMTILRMNSALVRLVDRLQSGS
jgi:hypothetical protein